MMKLIISLTLFWALCSTAGALRCHTCTDETCSTTTPQTCSTETMCISAAIEGTSSGTALPQIYKACAPSSQCPATGPQTFSVNLGGSSALVSATCCNTDNCNRDSVASPTTPADNSLQCNSCSTSACTTPLQCKGTEDMCFQATCARQVRARSPAVEQQAQWWPEAQIRNSLDQTPPPVQHSNRGATGTQATTMNPHRPVE
ncbi:phospholipase A2 inhibitor and Ly6/PLAUR domain-containing protein-like [Mugil cephalus]|uniref:phospholipase A2 inhibitor and Ly6/PLAUR domain-containing protein-like n=1 Tax=Mugil cephalus TaxID=48193 RepID=UPI001FB5CE64|nr:phospholipase A2 inhibitor and Ly6/PLAUR domain-containing protein-like [Mugil cephalus]